MKDLSDLYNKLSKKYNLPPFVIQGIITDQYRFIKKNLQDSKFPNIFVHGLGRFQVKDGRLDWMIRLLIDRVKNNRMDREEGKEEIYKLLQIRRKRKYGSK
tara:strand:+ start:397 stop:699 length:303 start_codon:yes stop_codon:yes gene_type:complete